MSYGRFENQGKGIEESSVTWWLQMPYKMLNTYKEVTFDVFGLYKSFGGCESQNHIE